MADPTDRRDDRSLRHTEEFRSHNAEFGVVEGTVTFKDDHPTGCTLRFSDGKVMWLTSDEMDRECAVGYAPRWDA
ncbi:MAG: hypothetical protein ABGX63_00685 [bacterium]